MTINIRFGIPTAEWDWQVFTTYTFHAEVHRWKWKKNDKECRWRALTVCESFTPLKLLQLLIEPYPHFSAPHQLPTTMYSLKPCIKMNETYAEKTWCYNLRHPSSTKVISWANVTDSYNKKRKISYFLFWTTCLSLYPALNFAL